MTDSAPTTLFAPQRESARAGQPQGGRTVKLGRAEDHPRRTGPARGDGDLTSSDYGLIRQA